LPVSGGGTSPPPATTARGAVALILGLRHLVAAEQRWRQVVLALQVATDEVVEQRHAAGVRLNLEVAGDRVRAHRHRPGQTLDGDIGHAVAFQAQAAATLELRRAADAAVARQAHMSGHRTLEVAGHDDLARVERRAFQHLHRAADLGALEAAGGAGRHAEVVHRGPADRVVRAIEVAAGCAHGRQQGADHGHPHRPRALVGWRVCGRGGRCGGGPGVGRFGFATAAAGSQHQAGDGHAAERREQLGAHGGSPREGVRGVPARRGETFAGHLHRGAARCIDTSAEHRERVTG
jgi:hypothetical protein